METTVEFVRMDDGTKLWHSSRQCPHSNENACAFCDHDRYYAHKYRAACPWWDLTEGATCLHAD